MHHIVITVLLVKSLDDDYDALLIINMVGHVITVACQALGQATYCLLYVV